MANNTSPAANAAATPASTASPTNAGNNTTEGNYLVGDVLCTITPDKTDKLELEHKVKCAGQDKARIYSRDDDPSKNQVVLASPDGKSRFVLDAATASNGTFTDEKGKTVSVKRAP